MRAIGRALPPVSPSPFRSLAVKIALVSPFDLAQPGGVASHVTHLGAELAKAGHAVTTIAPKAARAGAEVAGTFYGIGRTIAIPTNGSWARITLDLTRLRELRAILRRERFDVVHLHAPLTPALPWMVLLGSKAVNVATFHAYRAASAWYRVFGPLFAPLLGRLHGRIAVSGPARDFADRYFPGRYEVIPNGVDLERFGPQVEPFPWANDGVPRILFVGRFDEPRKGLATLLRALPLVRAAVPEARVLVVGTGRRERFARLLAAVGDGVEFAGYANPDVLPRFYASCEVFCSPATGNESLGIVLLEALASGTPVVASNIPGFASVVTSGEDGILVRPDDPRDLADALVRLLTDRTHRSALAEAGRVTAARYAWPRIAERVLAAYEAAALRAADG